MERCEVAVENSRPIATFGELKGTKLKDRYYPGHHRHHHPHYHHNNHQQSLVQQQPQPHQHIPQQYSQQPRAYHRYHTPSAAMAYSYINPVSNSAFHYPVVARRGYKYQHYDQPTALATGLHQPVISTSTPNSGVSIGRSKEKRQPCERFLTRGNCYYGVKCKFSHEPNPSNQSATQAECVNPDSLVATAGASSSAMPVARADTSRRRDWSKTSHQLAETEKLEQNHHDIHFPQLSAPARSRAASCSSSLTSNQSPERSSKASPRNKLVFRDAVLKQKHEDEPQCSSPTKSSLNSDGDSSETTDEDNSSNRSPDRDGSSKRSHRIHHPTARYRSNSDVPDSSYRYTRYTPRQVDNNYFFRMDQTQYAVALVQQQLINQRQAELERDRVGYSVYPAYLPNADYDVDVDRGYSVLNCQADQFVEGVDTQLVALETYHQSAIAKLQEVSRSLWSDAVIDIYGSNYTRLALPKSDVDCVLVSQASTSDEPSVVLQRLSLEVEEQEWATKVELLGSAKIPVLKIVFKSGVGGSEVMLDVTCGHSVGHSGLSARDLIYSYQAEMPALRPLVLILKTHIQRNGLNCSFTGGLSSYALVLLAIRFLQACGDDHYRVLDNASTVQSALWRGRRYSEGADGNHSSTMHGIAGSQSPDPESESAWIYVFSRDGKITWRTGLGNLLLLFLETYVTFDYRRYGISIENHGEYFSLPADKVVLEPGAVVSPYIVDPIKLNRSIGHCFRMHEVIQAWYVLYQSLASGVPLDEAVGRHGSV